MRELPEHAGFLEKTLLLLVAGLAAQHHLERDVAPELGVARGKDRAHATAGNLATGTIGGIHGARKNCQITGAASSPFAFTELAVR